MIQRFVVYIKTTLKRLIPGVLKCSEKSGEKKKVGKGLVLLKVI